MRPITVTVGPLAAGVNNCISTSQTGVSTLVINGSLASGGVATLDVARRVAIFSDSLDNDKYFTVTGTGATGQVQSETILGPDTSSVYTALDYKTVTSVTISANATGNITVGTNGVASTAWVRFDDFAPSNISIQCDAIGTVTYTVQSTLDDPNSNTNPVAAGSVLWVNSSDIQVINATTTQQSNFLFAPIYAKVTLTAGSGSVRATFLQSSNGPK